MDRDREVRPGCKKDCGWLERVDKLQLLFVIYILRNEPHQVILGGGLALCKTPFCNIWVTCGTLCHEEFWVLK